MIHSHTQLKHAHAHTYIHAQVMEQLLRFSIQHVLNKESSQYERLGGLYMAYTLHSSQPCQPQAVVGYITDHVQCSSAYAVLLHASHNWPIMTQLLVAKGRN